MDIIHNKPDSQLYAQTAAFADTVPYPHSRELSKDIGSVATSLLAGNEVTTTEKRWNGETVERTTSPNDYVDFLRSADPETRSDITFLSEKIDAFDDFSGSVDEALKGTEDDDHYLGRGSNGKAFKFEQDGEGYAVKTGGVGYRDVRAFHRGEAMSPDRNIARLAAIDLDHNRSVMSLVPGELAETLTFSERRAIPRAQIKDAVATALDMYDHGLVIDPKPSNFLYDKERGFGFIDYGAQDADTRTTRAEQAMSLRGMLTWHPNSPDEPRYGTPEYDAFHDQITSESTQILNTFLDVLEEDYPDVLQAAAEVQEKINNDPMTYSPGMVYDISSLPDNEEGNAFKARILRLGLQGTAPRKPVEYDDSDFEVIG